MSNDGYSILISNEKEIELLPKESKEIETQIKIQIPTGYVGLNPGPLSIYPTYRLKLQPSLISPNSNNTVKCKIQNLTDKNVQIPQGYKITIFIIQSNQLFSTEIWKLKQKGEEFHGQINISTVTAKKLDELEKRKIRLTKTVPVQNSIDTSLINLATPPEISATACMVMLGDQLKETLQCYAVDNVVYKEGIDRKTYFPVIINSYRVIACADNGSDLTLMQLSLFKKLFSNFRQLLSKSTEMKVKSYSDDAITVIGMVQVTCKFTKGGHTKTLMITVIKDINGNVPLFLYGNDSLRSTLATLSYRGDKTNPVPEIKIEDPQHLTLNTYYISPRELYTCTGEYELRPYEGREVKMYLPSAAPVIRQDEIIISPLKWQHAQVMPSKSDLLYVEEKDCYEAKAYIVNLTDREIRGTISARFEIMGPAISYPISRESKTQVLNIMLRTPPQREILEQESTQEINLNLPTVFNIDLKPGEGNWIKEEEIIESAGGNKVSYTGTAEIGPLIIEGGLELPTVIYKTPKEALNLNEFDPEIRPYIEKIFLEKYPETIALHSLDSGDVSKTLGYTALRLIPGETLPRHRRIYQLSPQDSRYLEELLEQFIRFNYVRRAPADSTNIHLYGMSTYLVPRKKLTDIARLVIDFSPLTSIIQSPPSIVPDISASLQQLQGKALYTVMDLKYAYLALRIDEESKPLTTFLTQGGAYQWLSIPTGAACSPAYFIDAVNRILHYKPVLDNHGNPIYESNNKVKLERDILPNSFHYFDDILCSSEPKKTYKETLDYHFQCLEKIIYRLAFHGVKLSVNKSEFAKSKVLFLGWIVSHDYIIPDPRRMEKIKNAEFPKTKKEVRSFLGLVNSIRRVVPFEVIKEIQILTPLTSSTATFQVTAKHRSAFEKIKGLLLQEPLFCNLIKENATKYLWVDAASSSGCLGAVLAQRITPGEDEDYLPETINLEDKVHRIIYDRKLPYEPGKLYTNFPIQVSKITLPKTRPPDTNEIDEYHGFNEKNGKDSLFWSIISLMVLYNCKIPTGISELRKLAVTELKKGVLAIKLKDMAFNNDHRAYRNYLQEFENGEHELDDHSLLIQALARGLHRCFIILDSTAEEVSKKIIKYNTESTKPPLIFGLYKTKIGNIYTPYFHNKNLEFNISSLKGKIQIIAYLAKSVPEAYKSRSILDLEALAILTALHSLQRYISNTKCYLLTDSRVLYYLFSQRIADSSTKIKRWVLKLLSDYPLVKLYFVNTNANLADYLTRQGLPTGDVEKLNLKHIEIKDMYKHLPKHEFTLAEWSKFCEDHPEYLTINQPSQVSTTVDTAINHIIREELQPENTSSYNIGLENIQDLTTPLTILKEKLERSNIIKAQKQELNEIYSNCLASDEFNYKEDKGTEYKLVTDLLMIKVHEGYKIYIPESLIGPLLSHTHLLGHQGLTKMLKNLESYHFNQKYAKVKRFVSSCYACFMSHGSNKKTKLGNYPIPEYPFEEVSVDLAESLNTVAGLSHLLIVQCVLSDFILIYPLKTKSAQEVCKVFLYNVLQSFNVARVHQDNGPCFRNLQWLQLMAALNIKIVNSSALNPSSRGKAERAVGQVKTLMKKLLSTASSNTLNWELLPFLVSKIMNHTITPRTGFKPAELIFGKDQMAQSFLDKDRLVPAHHLVMNNKQQIETLTKELNTMAQTTRQSLIQLRQETHEKINQSRPEKGKNFKPNDIVFVLDRYNLPGNTRPLKTKFYPSPYVVLKPYFTTCLVRRLADGFTALYSMDDLKKYQGTDPVFSTLPPEVSKVLLHEFKELIDTDFKTLMQYDPLDIPTGIQLTDTVDPEHPDHQEIFPARQLTELEDEFYRETEQEQPQSGPNEQQIIDKQNSPQSRQAQKRTGPMTRSRRRHQEDEDDMEPEPQPSTEPQTDNRNLSTETTGENNKISKLEGSRNLGIIDELEEWQDIEGNNEQE